MSRLKLTTFAWFDICFIGFWRTVMDVASLSTDALLTLSLWIGLTLVMGRRPQISSMAFNYLSLRNHDDQVDLF